MQEEGWSRSKVRKGLKAAHARDFSFQDGAILGSMCTQPHPAALEAHSLFAATNLGDPDHFPGTKALEDEVLGDACALLHAPPGAGARLMTGGTEANLYALYVARQTSGKKAVVLPEHAHFSFEKAARLLGMDLRWVPSADDGRADVDAMAKAAKRHAAVMVGVAGSTELGLVDPIPELAQAALDRDVALHVDGAFGGYVLPFLEAAGRPAAPFDFRVDGVTSISLDPHKGGMSTIPGGLLVLRDGRQWDQVAVETPYVSTQRQSQLLGTRPGGAAAAVWAVHRSLGRTGFTEVVKECMATTDHLVAGLAQRGITPVKPPELNVVTFAVPDPTTVMQALHDRGLRVNAVPRLGALRIVVNPHVTRKAIDRFLVILDEVLE